LFEPCRGAVRMCKGFTVIVNASIFGTEDTSLVY